MSEEHEDNEIEKKFRESVAKHGPAIEEQLEVARKALREAVKLSNKHGVPFRGPPGNFNDSYMPESMPEGLDSDLVYDLTEACPGEYGGCSGWQTSHC